MRKNLSIYYFIFTFLVLFFFFNIFKRAHARVRTFAESIAFFSGERDELSNLNSRLQNVLSGSLSVFKVCLIYLFFIFYLCFCCSVYFIIIFFFLATTSIGYCRRIFQPSRSLFWSIFIWIT